MGSLGEAREVRRQFWLLIRAGLERRKAALALGLSDWTGKAWFRQAGGVIPAYVTAPTSGRFLSEEERIEIFGGIQRGDSMRGMARAIGRAPSTVSRELRRNGRPQYGRRRAPASRASWAYRPKLAQRRAERLASRPKVAKLATNRRLRDLVQGQLQQRLSPEQVAAFLRRQFPDNRDMWVSHETIYQSIYVQGRGALRRELAVCLRTGRAVRKPRRKEGERRGRIPGMVMLSERPAEAQDRAVPGHWEGDLLIGKNGGSAIGTLVERKTRYLILLHLPNGQSADEVEKAMVAATKRLPETLWKSLTWDQGWEMKNHAKISVATNLEIYFCDPASPWQRGSNENTNGLLRQYFPKGTDLSVHSAEHLEFVAAEMNERPRKTLDWDEPREVLAQLLSESSRQQAVASTD